MSRFTHGARLPREVKSLIRLFFTVFLVITSASVQAALPSGWSDTDIGAPGDAGSASAANGLWTVAGGGADIWGNADQFNFVSQTLNCDGAVVARVLTVQNSDPGSGWSKAGVMFRNDTTAGAVNAMMTATAGQGVTFQVRTAAGAASGQCHGFGN